MSRSAEPLPGDGWIDHHAMFRDIVRSDDVLLLSSVLHLVLIALLPVPTAVLARASSRGVGEAVAAAFYLWPRRVASTIVT